MGKKRSSETSEERIERKIRRLEVKLRKRRKQIIYSSEDELECPPHLSVETSTKIPYEHEIFSPPDDAPHAEHERTSSMMPEPLLPTEAMLPTETESPPPATGIAAESIANDEDMPLDDETLFLLGEAPEADITFSKQVHKDLAARWREILKKGLNKETKEQLLKEYLIPENCELLVPPVLNSEVKVALAENFVKRDASMAARQRHLSVAVAALTQTVNNLISKSEYKVLKQDVLKPVSDACRILCEMHHFETQTRKKFVISSINSDIKETLINSKTDKYLFGENLPEKLRDAKSIQKSAEALKINHKVNQRNSASTSKSRGNFRSLYLRRPDTAKTQMAPRLQTGYARGRAAYRAPRDPPAAPPPPFQPSSFPPPPPAPYRKTTRR